MSKRMLIVDDEPNLRWMLGRYFTLCGYCVFSASTLHDAVEAVRNTRFHVVLTDLMLSSTQDGEGWTLAARVREDSPDTRILMLTGHSMSEVMRDARTAAVDVVLAKPQRLADLAMHVAKLAALAEVAA